MGAFSLRTTAHRRELHEARDEILIGEVIAAMADAGRPVVGIASDVDHQRVRFLALGDPILHTIAVGVGSAEMTRTTATLVIEAEVKNLIADPDGLVRAAGQIARALASAPKGAVSLDRDLNTVSATTRRVVRLGERLGADQAVRDDLRKLLAEAVTELRATLEPCKTDGGAGQD